MNASTDHTLTLISLAQEALSANDGKTEAAIVALDKRLFKDHALRTAVISQAVKEAARSLVSLAHRQERVAIMRSIAHSTDGRTQVHALASGMARSLLDFPLLDGTKLRDATQDDLRRAIGHYRTQAETMNRRASWLEAVLALMPAQGRVGDAIDEETAQRLFHEAGQ